MMLWLNKIVRDRNGPLLVVAHNEHINSDPETLNLDFGLCTKSLSCGLVSSDILYVKPKRLVGINLYSSPYLLRKSVYNLIMGLLTFNMKILIGLLTLYYR